MKASCPFGPLTGLGTGGVVKTIGTAAAPSVRLIAVLYTGLPRNDTFHACQPRAPAAVGGSQMPASQYHREYSSRPAESRGPAKICFSAETCGVVRQDPPCGTLP